jgi:membrane protease YdiL (CAAX protease family)
LIWLALIVAAPLFEETFFRGFLFKGFESSFIGPSGAVLATAGLWAVIHAQYNLYEMTIIFCLGLLLGGARRATGTLSVPLALHAVVNLVATIEAALFG